MLAGRPDRLQGPPRGPNSASPPPTSAPVPPMSDPLEFQISLYPTPVLRKVADPVEAFDEALAEIVSAMYRRMVESKGVGLAAPQVGLKRRILVVNATGEEEDNLTLINPTLVKRSGPATTFEEGCLSFPGIYAEVSRPSRCRVKAFNLQGEEFEAEYDDFVSRIIQHEYDHLEGILLVDRMSPADKLRHKAVLEEMIEDYRATQASAT
ncbi:MAG: peptide deformylase [Chlamydiales bacterium]|jgi:peptide deformylase